ncbi:hypothetical protein MRX96_053863 [Rhipicephalus microplus]
MPYGPHRQKPSEVIVYCLAEVADVVTPNYLRTGNLKARERSSGLSTSVNGKDISFRHREHLTDVPLEGGHTLEWLLHTGTHHCALSGSCTHIKCDVVSAPNRTHRKCS